MAKTYYVRVEDPLGVPLRSLFLTPGATVVLGRGMLSDVRIPCEGLSRAHAKISHDSGQIYASDLNSTNGTLLGGVPLSSTPTRVEPGLEELWLASHKVIFERRVGLRLEQTLPQVQELMADRDVQVRFCAGVGAHGSVWVGLQESLRRHVAIKVVNGEEQFERAQREAMLTTKVSSRAVVRCFDFSRQDQTSFMVMEYVQGISLAERLKAGPLPVELALSIAQDLVEALTTLEEHALVHRDVKPTNVLIDAHHRAKLCDLGIGKDLDEPGDLTAVGSGLGSLPFMAPEQMQDATTVGHAADLYGLGATLYCMLAGEPPPIVQPERYRRGSGEAPGWIERCARPLDQVRGDCPPPLARLVEQLLRDDPQERPPSARVVGETLRWLEEHSRPRVSPDRPTKPHSTERAKGA